MNNFFILIFGLDHVIVNEEHFCAHTVQRHNAARAGVERSRQKFRTFLAVSSFASTEQTLYRQLLLVRNFSARAAH